MPYDEETIEDMRITLQRAEAEVYSAMTAAQDHVVGNVILENMLDEIHNDILSALKQL